MLKLSQYSTIKRAINNLIEPGESLSQRAVRGGFWVFGLRITERVFKLIRLIILVRILVPHDFGLMGIALLTMATLETFSQTGFQAALIQKKENTDAYLDAAWTVLILRGFLLFAILFFLAPYAAIFFKSPQAKPIIQIIGLSVLLQAFTNIGIVYFQKELEFNKQFLYQLSGTLADFIVAVSAALILRSVWALVFGLLAGNVARLIVSYLIQSYRPHLSLDLGRAKGLFGFGKWIMGSSILIFLLTQGDGIFVGKLLGATMLGFYQVAYRISNMSATEITHVISQVTFPAYSKLQDNLPKLREAYLKTLQITAFLSIPLAGMIFILAPEFTSIFLGEKWIPMVPAMRALCIFGMTRSIGATFGSIFNGVGKPMIQTKISAIQLIIMAFIIYPLTVNWGILGASFAVVIANLISLGLGTREMKYIIKFGNLDFIKLIFLPTSAVFVVSFFMLAVQKFLWYRKDLIGFLAILLSGGTIYLGIMYLFDRTINYRLRQTLRGMFKSF